MSTPHPIDFQAIKSRVSIVQVLEHYGLLEKMRQNGDTITGDCPIHKNNGRVAFRANATIGFWNCFNQCSCSGDIFDFVARKEKVSLQKAARIIAGWFEIPLEASKPETEEAANHAEMCEAHPPPIRPPTATPQAASGQMTFEVKRYWEVCDTVRVPATSVAQAIQIAHSLPLNTPRAEFVPDSLNSDPDADVQPVTA